MAGPRPPLLLLLLLLARLAASLPEASSFAHHRYFSREHMPSSLHSMMDLITAGGNKGF